LRARINSKPTATMGISKASRHHEESYRGFVFHANNRLDSFVDIKNAGRKLNCRTDQSGKGILLNNSQ
jgi:hypothetical protein